MLAILNQYHIDFDPTVNRGWVNVQCPMPGCTDSGRHGGFNISGSYYHCWKCGGHDLKYTFKRLLHISDEKADELIQANEGRLNMLDRLNKKVATAPKVVWPGKPLIPIERKYLKGRGYDPDYLVEQYGIAGGGIAGPWRFRILVPLFQDKKLVSFLGRDITEQSNQRYKNLNIEKSVIDPKHCLYNLDHCRKDHAAVLEGPTDVWTMGDGFVATLGTSVTPEQIRLLGQRFRKVTFLFDPEAEAQGKARKVGAQLAAMGTEVELVDLELDHDPGDCDEDEVRYIRRELGL